MRASASGAASEAMLITRLAPSPTGSLHLGNARTFLINWLLARQRGWKIILRIEDLDSPRLADRFDELLTPTAYVPRDRKLTSTARQLAKGATPAEAVVLAAEWVHDEMDYITGTTIFVDGGKHLARPIRPDPLGKC